MNGSSDAMALIKDLNQTYGWELAGTLTIQELEARLAEIVNGWIRSDFTRLVQFLYRIDISESRLRVLLEGDTIEDTGQLLARLIIERLGQKIETRRQYNQGQTTSDEERW